ncbi:MAG: hypothetical protein A2901_01355 [Elusimicrobia bacterium RIFCSPLOWO2_01_FULL_54_10]|nr:MAG: hypothetical protein A2901_01355 [Elusimicrobia bacterium RIFCSPLOWO2_01_FULL_54_10]
MKKILIVEDDLSLAELMRARLEKENYEVRVERDGRHVGEIAKKNHPDLILLDAVLPGLDGRSIHQTLLSDPATKKIPVLVVSANAQLEQAFVDLENVKGFVHKPFDNAHLIAKVSEALKA